MRLHHFAEYLNAYQFSESLIKFPLYIVLNLMLTWIISLSFIYKPTNNNALATLYSLYYKKEFHLLLVQ
jgi:hypothetical protein